MGEAEMDAIADLISRALAGAAEDRILAGVKAEVEQLCRKFPLYPERQG
jgi:glycine/serine hydroxymethyltransferase